MNGEANVKVILETTSMEHGVLVSDIVDDFILGLAVMEKFGL